MGGGGEEQCSEQWTGAHRGVVTEETTKFLGCKSRQRAVEWIALVFGQERQANAEVKRPAERVKS